LKTSELIDVLATASGPVRSGTVARTVVKGASAGFLGALVLMLALLGVRHDWPDALTLPMFWVKLAFAFSSCVGAAILTSRLGQPGRSTTAAVPVAVAPVVVIWLAALLMLVAAGTGTRTRLLLGSTWLACPWLIALISLPAFAAAMWVQRELAPVRLRAAGASAGFLAGSIATLVYVLHCPEMALPFVAIWYVLGMAVPAAAGALLGPRLLRW
jgi:hypothetical protein